MKYSEELKHTIIKLIAEGDLSIAEMCDKLGLSKSDFVNWKKDDPDFAEGIQIATEVRYENRSALAWRAQRRLLEGYNYEEVSEEMEYIHGDSPEDPVVCRVVKRKVTSRHVRPSTSATIHALKSLDPRFNQPDRFDHSTLGQPITALPNIFLNIPKGAKSLKAADADSN